MPYNHQNEWAYAIARTEQPSTCKGTKSAGHQIVDHFMRHVAPSGVFPNSGRWDYWWGTAYDGWTAQNNVSKNKPSYPGDKIKAWISFRTIDLMSVLANIEQFDPMTRSNLLISARHQIFTGKVYPFANYELMRAGSPPLLSLSVARQYIRITSPWELQNAPWAYLALLRGTDVRR